MATEKVWAVRLHPSDHKTISARLKALKQRNENIGECLLRAITALEREQGIEPAAAADPVSTRLDDLEQKIDNLITTITAQTPPPQAATAANTAANGGQQPTHDQNRARELILAMKDQHTVEQIAAELNRQGLCNRKGEPYNARAVDAVIDRAKKKLADR